MTQHFVTRDMMTGVEQCQQHVRHIRFAIKLIYGKLVRFDRLFALMALKSLLNYWICEFKNSSNQTIEVTTSNWFRKCFWTFAMNRAVDRKWFEFVYFTDMPHYMISSQKCVISSTQRTKNLPKFIFRILTRRASVIRIFVNFNVKSRQSNRTGNLSAIITARNNLVKLYWTKYVVDGNEPFNAIQ